MTEDKETCFTLAGTRTEAITRGRLPGGVKESLQAKQKSRGLCLGKSQRVGRRRDGVTLGRYTSREPTQSVLSSQHWGMSDRMRSDPPSYRNARWVGAGAREPGKEAIAALNSQERRRRTPAQPLRDPGGRGGADLTWAVVPAQVLAGKLTCGVTLGRSLSLSGPQCPCFVE